MTSHWERSKRAEKVEFLKQENDLQRLQLATQQLTLNELKARIVELEKRLGMDVESRRAVMMEIGTSRRDAI
jgi:hypothetical protein